MGVIGCGNPAAIRPEERECARLVDSTLSRLPVDYLLLRQNAGADGSKASAWISPRSLRRYIGHNSKAATRREGPTIRYWHVLPENWQTMKYEDFLKKRRG
jgi:hypothetical protein